MDFAPRYGLRWDFPDWIDLSRLIAYTPQLLAGIQNRIICYTATTLASMLILWRIGRINFTCRSHEPTAIAYHINHICFHLRIYFLHSFTSNKLFLYFWERISPHFIVHEPYLRWLYLVDCAVLILDKGESVRYLTARMTANHW